MRAGAAIPRSPTTWTVNRKGRLDTEDAVKRPAQTTRRRHHARELCGLVADDEARRRAAAGRARVAYPGDAPPGHRAMRQGAVGGEIERPRCAPLRRAVGRHEVREIAGRERRGERHRDQRDQPGDMDGSQQSAHLERTPRRAAISMLTGPLAVFVGSLREPADRGRRPRFVAGPIADMFVMRSCDTDIYVRLRPREAAGPGAAAAPGLPRRRRVIPTFGSAYTVISTIM